MGEYITKKYAGLIIFGLTLIIGSVGPVFAQATGSSATAVVIEKDTTRGGSALDDGPHVFWRSDSSAIVFYHCNGEADKRNFTFRDTLRFRGFCRDTMAEYVIPVNVIIDETCIFEEVSKIFAVSDIHGEYDFLLDILANSGVIDSRGRWTWGEGHLVIDGDIFDRGDRVTECLWFIYRLEQEADRAGGKVHYLLGNHELMVLRGDKRYVHEKYLEGVVKTLRIRYEDLFGPEMELGRWLRSKPTVIKINEIIFVHGGLNLVALQFCGTVAGINEIVRRGIDMRSSGVAFNDTVNFVFGSMGPLWYRGYHYAMEDKYLLITPDEIDRVLASFDARTIVVGHSEVDRVTGLFDNRIMAIDVPLETIGSFQALLWHDDRFYRVHGDGRRQLLFQPGSDGK